MDTKSISKSQYILNDKWNLYYHLPHDKKWDITSYKLIIGTIDNAQKLIAINETLPENVIKNCMLFVMREGITPMWEDPKNRNGGCFSFKVPNKQVQLVWRFLFYSICGETLCIEKKHNQFINGITVSPKRNFCILKIWLSDCSLQDPNILIDIVNLSKTGCLFKKHEPEF